MSLKGIILTGVAWLCCMAAMAQQQFFNLTANEVRVDTVLHSFVHSFQLSGAHADSLYEVEIAYPDFIDMTKKEAEQVELLMGGEHPAMPKPHVKMGTEQKQAFLTISFPPFVHRDGKWKKIVSFMLNVKSTPKHQAESRQLKARKRADMNDFYADHSVLASGNWAKIRVAKSGFHQLTDALIRKAGFSNLSKVKIYGYGGAKQDEMLDPSILIDTDDLKEVPTCTIAGRRLFYAQGPVSWQSRNASERIRNPYSDYGYYFITQSEEDPLTVDSTSFVDSVYPNYDDYHSLHEVDDFAWFEGGNRLFESKPINVGENGYAITLDAPEGALSGRLTVLLTSPVNGATASVIMNDSILGDIVMSTPTASEREYEHARENKRNFMVNNVSSTNTITISCKNNGPVRIDYVSLAFTKPRPLPNLATTSFDAPEYVYNITNQDLHADAGYNMVIIIPTSLKLKEQAERLKALHEKNDGMKVRIVPADELYNEFSSGTPDANAYRRYMKMLYDRAESKSDMPTHLLLLGDCAWDNRMNTPAWKGYKPDDFLLCHESDNSFSKTKCYVNDGFFCCLDDGEGDDPLTGDFLDIAVGRIPARTAEEAAIMVDKTIAYVENKNAGAWQNTVMVMGDDGNNNVHMSDALEAAQIIEDLQPGIYVKRVMWDAYPMISTSTGNTYPDVSNVIKQQHMRGALLMDYVGHASETSISHEKVLMLNEIENFTNANLPLWVTAACEVMPFDGQTDCIGESLLMNKKGGALAIFGTTRTVYTNFNKYLNKAYMRALFAPVDGKFVSIGEAQRLAKNEVMKGYKYIYVNARGETVTSTEQDRTENKLQYSLLGDPAVVLHIPTLTAVVDEVNGQAPNHDNPVMLKAGSITTIKGHVEQNGTKLNNFNGTVNITVRDAEEQITCKLNNTTDDGADNPLTYNDRTKVLFNGQDNVKNGEFTISFPVSKDISYSNGYGKVNVYVLQDNLSQAGNGTNSDFIIGGSDLQKNDSIGPSIYCYLNSPQFQNGDKVNTTPYFVAELFDKDGLNTTGMGIGHNLELVIDGKLERTYMLNDNFEYDFGSYTKGKTYYSIPELEIGVHKLMFRAWDIQNNSSTAELTFNVVRAMEPNCLDVNITQNPVRNTTAFIINHDRAGSVLDVALDIFDMSGRLLWTHEESGMAASNTYRLDWDSTQGNGLSLQTGVYLYRIRLSCEGSNSSSKAKKLIIIR